MFQLSTPVNEQDHQAGNLQAPTTLVEYGDFQCSRCGAAYPLIKELLKEYKDELNFIFRHFPLHEIHPQAMITALAAEAAGRQGKFWEMHDVLFQNQDSLMGNSILNYAEALHLDITKFGNDWKNNDQLSKVESDFRSGLESGVSGTPSFYINGQRLNSYDESYKSLSDAVRNLAGG